MQKEYGPYFYLELDAFGETPDTRFFFESETHCRALENLVNALHAGHGFSLLSGEVGTGKTMLTRMLLQICAHSTDTAVVLFPRCSEAELIRSICEEFGIEGLATFNPDSAKNDLDALNNFLLSNARVGRRSLLVIDEAQNLPIATLETVRMLSNFESNDQKLLQILLVAQPEFLATIARPDLRQLRQRIGCTAYLEPFRKGETKDYVKYRVERAGGANFVRFEPEALNTIHAMSGGLPRIINRSVHLLLTYCYEEKIRLVTPKVVRNWRAGRRTQKKSPSWKFWARRGAELR